MDGVVCAKAGGRLFLIGLGIGKGEEVAGVTGGGG